MRSPFRCPVFLFRGIQNEEKEVSLQSRAGGLFVLIEGVGVDVQRGGGLAVAEDARHRGHIRAACDHQAGGGVPEGMDVQLLR